MMLVLLKVINKKFQKNKAKKLWIDNLSKIKDYLDEDNKYKNDNNFVNSFRFINFSNSLSGDENIVTDMGTSFTCTMQSFKTKNQTFYFIRNSRYGFWFTRYYWSIFATKKTDLYFMMVINV